MNKLIAVFALVACAGCAETTADGKLVLAGMEHGPAASFDAPATREPVAVRDVAPREPSVRPRASRAEGDYVLCAQCR